MTFTIGFLIKDIFAYSFQCACLYCLQDEQSARTAALSHNMALVETLIIS